MGYGQYGAWVRSQVLFQPQYGFSIQVVSRLIEQQQVWLLQEKLAQCHTATFTTAEMVDHLVARWATQSVHCLFELVVDVPRVGSVDSFLQLAHLF